MTPAGTGSPASIGRLLAAGEGRPVVLVPSVGSTPLSLERLARAIEPRRPVYAFSYAGIEDDSPPQRTLGQMATACVDDLLACEPRGPYLLWGHCLGGSVALAAALELEARGLAVERLVVADSLAPLIADSGSGRDAAGAASPAVEEHFRRTIESVVRRMFASMPALEPRAFVRLGGIVTLHIEAGVAYRARPLRAPIDILRTAEFPQSLQSEWARIAAGGLAIHEVPGDTFSMLKPPHVVDVGRVLGRVLRGSDR